jgi:putative RNA 2'-phosphotransferase
MDKQLKHISKLMSLVLRHQPDTIGLQLDANGWALVDELVERINAKGIKADHETIRLVVETNDKKRFAFNADQTKIRASQGHSLTVELNLEAVVPPAILYHGTAAINIESILQTGIQRQSRQHVHLSETTETAKAVGSRHGKPVILTIATGAMHIAGYKFYLSANRVWLTDAVPPEFISR